MSQHSRGCSLRGSSPGVLATLGQCHYFCASTAPSTSTCFLLFLLFQNLHSRLPVLNACFGTIWVCLVSLLNPDTHTAALISCSSERRLLQQYFAPVYGVRPYDCDWKEEFGSQTGNWRVLCGGGLLHVTSLFKYDEFLGTKKPMYTT